MNKDQAKNSVEKAKGIVKKVDGKVLCTEFRDLVRDTVWRKYGGAFRQSVSSHL